ncbi:hypothetical protein [Lacipirellula sp.]|uniref:hypothetical protein n=1 Tax=Lacipirellula sp. TaxID=2691419 RepID=UPI003D135FB4
MKTNTPASNKSPMVAFYYAAAVAAIALVADMWGYAATGARGVGMTAYLCFMPLAFMFVCHQAVLQKKELDALRDEVAKLRTVDA